MDELLKIAAANQQRAREVIRDTDLEAIWQQVGAEPNLVGSLRTGLLMTHRDIDFHIYSSPLRLADSFAAMARLAENSRIRSITFNNLLDAPDQCLEWHAWYADADDRLWQIDMIHMPKGSAYDGYFERVADRIAAVRALMPDAFIGIDVIVGFPGETEEDFRTTYDFLEGLKPAFLHIFPFSERPGTPAVDMPGKVQPSVATRRVAELEELCGRLHGAFCAKAVGSEDTVLFESTLRGGMMFGYTGSYRRVKAPYDRTRINAICRVRFGAMDESHDLMGDILD